MELQMELVVGCPGQGRCRRGSAGSLSVAFLQGCFQRSLLAPRHRRRRRNAVSPETSWPGLIGRNVLGS